MLKNLILFIFCALLISSCNDDSTNGPNKNSAIASFPLTIGNSWVKHSARFNKAGTIISESDKTTTIGDTMSFEIADKKLLLFITSKNDERTEGLYEDDKAYYHFELTATENFYYTKIMEKHVTINKPVLMVSNQVASTRQIMLVDIDASTKFNGNMIPCYRFKILKSNDPHTLRKDFLYWSNEYGLVLEERRKYDSNFKQFLLEQRIELSSAEIK